MREGDDPGALGERVVEALARSGFDRQVSGRKEAQARSLLAGEPLPSGTKLL